MNIQILAIQFNHNPGTIDTNALNIRQNHLQNITVPEWTPQKDGVASKAAYSIKDTNGKTITIQAKFSCDTAGDVRVRAQGGGRMGTVASTLITPSRDAFFSFPLTATDLHTDGIAVINITWQWQYQNAESNWVDIKSTNHRIYTVLELPSAPWSHSNDADDDQLPWTDLLEVGCAWAGGATTTDAVSKIITEKLYALGEAGLISYDTVDGGTHYAWPNFQLTQFLKKLNGEAALGDKVNCSDCATIVSSFANILGANLGQSRMGADFELRSLRAIGTKAWAVPFEGAFSYHEVAWEPDFKAGNNLYDACLELNTNRGAGVPVSLLPVKMAYGTCDTTSQSYISYLATSAADGCAICAPMPGTAKRRKVV
jgi:hypothetical protein